MCEGLGLGLGYRCELYYDTAYKTQCELRTDPNMGINFARTLKFLHVHSRTEVPMQRRGVREQQVVDQKPRRVTRPGLVGVALIKWG